MVQETAEEAREMCRKLLLCYFVFEAVMPDLVKGLADVS